jgi:hypothetical protein
LVGKEIARPQPNLLPMIGTVQEKENPLESSGCFMRIHQSSRGYNSKRWEHITFSAGEKAGMRAG